MAGTVTPPPINVSAAAPGYAPVSPSSQLPAPAPGLVVRAQLEQRLQQYAEGYWREMLVKLMREQSAYMEGGEVKLLNPAVGMDFLVVSHADQYMCLNPEVSMQHALFHALRNLQPYAKVSDVTELSAGPLTAVAALSHFLFGKGEAVATDINRLSINLATKNIPALEQAFSSALVGSSPICVGMFSYDMAQDSWLTGAWLGSIPLRLEGMLHKRKDNSFTFSGGVRAYDNTYDANRSTHRELIGEEAARVLVAIQSYLGAVPYTIAIKGEMPIVIER